jgi:hypothetical protein
VATTVIVHILNADAILAEIDEIPDPSSNYVTLTNARARDNKPLVYIDREATRVLVPWHRISFMETLPSEEDMEEVETFFRD